MQPGHPQPSAASPSPPFRYPPLLYLRAQRPRPSRNSPPCTRARRDSDHATRSTNRPERASANPRSSPSPAHPPPHLVAAPDPASPPLPAASASFPISERGQDRPLRFAIVEINRAILQHLIRLMSLAGD